VPIKLYADHHVDFAIVKGLRIRNVDILTAFEDKTNRLDDPDLLDRAGKLKRVLFTQDKDFLAEATKRQRSGVYFYGVIFGKQNKALIRRYIEDLEYLAKAGNPQDFENSTFYLPL
jgi:hypothetical protein